MVFCGVLWCFVVFCGGCGGRCGGCGGYGGGGGSDDWRHAVSLRGRTSRNEFVGPVTSGVRLPGDCASPDLP